MTEIESMTEFEYCRGIEKGGMAWASLLTAAGRYHFLAFNDRISQAPEPIATIQLKNDRDYILLFSDRSVYIVRDNWEPESWEDYKQLNLYEELWKEIREQLRAQG